MWIATWTPRLVGDAQARVDRGRRRAPVLVQLEAAGAGRAPARAAPPPRRCCPCRAAATLTGLLVERDEHRARARARPACTVVAFVPSAGPVPPPISVVIPEASASVDDLRADEVDVAVDAAGGEDAALAGEDLRRRADPQRGVDAVGDVGVAGLAERDDAPVADADVALDDAPVVEHDGVRDHQIGRALGARRRALQHRLADRLAAAEDGLVAADAVVALDLDPEVGVGEPHLVADGRAVERGVAVAADPHSVPSRRRPGHAPRARRARRARRRVDTPGSNRTDVPAGHVEPEAARRVAVEVERRVRLGEVEVRADLDRPVAGVRRPAARRARGRRSARARPRPCRSSPGITGSARAGSPACARRGTSPRSAPRRRAPGTPSITSSRESTSRPACISCSTVRSPSRAASSTQHESSATASGSLSFTPRARRSRATIPATESSSFSCSEGESFTTRELDGRERGRGQLSLARLPPGDPASVDPRSGGGGGRRRGTPRRRASARSSKCR